MDHVLLEDIIRIIAAFSAGAALGFEREYRSKPAGLRTLIMITVGACLFTILSKYLGNAASADRVASNIVTGIGFIGAGVIFKEGLNVKGITTASTIWVAAAIGMAIGTGNYVLALVTLVFVLITLVVLSKLEEKLNSFHKVKQYEISFYIEQYSLEKLEAMFTKLKVSFLRYRFTRNDKLVTAYYKIEANQDEYEQLMRFLMETREISKFQS
jgi:putative Mg2+ transporter-C (MgtC) family protein